ncbi:MAG: GyrI-like domain-containing protein, partial [Pauljensenia sp.]
MADKIDFRRTLDAYRAQRDVLRIVDVPDMRYLMIDGHGDPNTSPTYTEALAALYPVAYTLKFASKRELGRDYVVPPLEGLWWAEDMDSFTVARDKTRWSWTMMLMVPDWIDHDMVDSAITRTGQR